MNGDWRISRDSVSSPDLAELLSGHLRNMREITPGESVHALGLDAYDDPLLTLWTVREGDELLGCGALMELAPDHGEVKSMRTAEAHRRRGVGAAVLKVIISEAAARGYRRLSLETGAGDDFAPARRMYEVHGFTECGPFGAYRPDVLSKFFTMDPLEAGGPAASLSRSARL